jgi:hypothetical protein
LYQERIQANTYKRTKFSWIKNVSGMPYEERMRIFEIVLEKCKKNQGKLNR